VKQKSEEAARKGSLFFNFARPKYREHEQENGDPAIIVDIML